MRLTGDPKIDLALRELYKFMERFTTKNVDFNGRRITNAGMSKDPDDYVVRKELPQLVAGGRTQIITTTGGGGGLNNTENVVFGIGVSIPVIVGNDATPPRPWVNPRNGRPVATVLVANQSPTGADLKIDIKKNGFTIFDDGFVTLPQGTPDKEITAWVGSSVYTGTTFSQFDVLTIDVLQVGSVIAGQDISVFTLCTLI